MEPVEESEVVAEPVRNAAIEERPTEPNGVHALVDIPRARMLVAAVIPEVVCLPGQRRKDDGHSIHADAPRRDHEGAKPRRPFGARRRTK